MSGVRESIGYFPPELTTRQAVYYANNDKELCVALTFTIFNIILNVDVYNIVKSGGFHH